MQAQQICLLASRIAKGGTGMVTMAGQFLNLVLEDLKLNRNLKINRVTQVVTVQAGSNGPFTLESDYLRTYDMFYPLQTPLGMTQFLNPVTMEQYDAEFKAIQTANYPYEFATDLSTQAQAATATGGVTSVTSLVQNTAGYGLQFRPTVTISGGGGVGATGTVDMQVVAQLLQSAGTGYLNGDILTAIGGTFTRPYKVQLFANGFTPSNCVVLDYGDYTVVPGTPQFSNSMGPVSFSGGSGTNGLMQLVWGITNPQLTAGGSGFTGAPSAIVSSGNAVVQGTLTAATSTSAAVNGAGQFYIYPQSNAQLSITHRYMRKQPDLVTPETSTQVPWFPFTQYLIHATAAHLMGVTGDDRQSAFLKESEEMLRPYLIMEGDEQQAVQSIRLDPRRFRSGRFARPIKSMPF